MRGAGVGASNSCPLTRPFSHRQVNSPDSAPDDTIGAVVSQLPTCAFSVARSWAQWSASRSIRKFIANTSPADVTEPELNTFVTAAYEVVSAVDGGDNRGFRRPARSSATAASHTGGRGPAEVSVATAQEPARAT